MRSCLRIAKLKLFWLIIGRALGAALPQRVTAVPNLVGVPPWKQTYLAWCYPAQPVTAHTRQRQPAFANMLVLRSHYQSQSGHWSLSQYANCFCDYQKDCRWIFQIQGDWSVKNLSVSTFLSGLNPLGFSPVSRRCKLGWDGFLRWRCHRRVVLSCQFSTKKWFSGAIALMTEYGRVKLTIDADQNRLKGALRFDWGSRTQQKYHAFAEVMEGVSNAAKRHLNSETQQHTHGQFNASTSASQQQNVPVQPFCGQAASSDSEQGVLAVPIRKQTVDWLNEHGHAKGDFADPDREGKGILRFGAESPERQCEITPRLLSSFGLEAERPAQPASSVFAASRYPIPSRAELVDVAALAPHRDRDIDRKLANWEEETILTSLILHSVDSINEKTQALVENLSQADANATLIRLLDDQPDTGKHPVQQSQCSDEQPLPRGNADRKAETVPLGTTTAPLKAKKQKRHVNFAPAPVVLTDVMDEVDDRKSMAHEEIARVPNTNGEEDPLLKSQSADHSESLIRKAKKFAIQNPSATAAELMAHLEFLRHSKDQPCAAEAVSVVGETEVNALPLLVESSVAALESIEPGNMAIKENSELRSDFPDRSNEDTGYLEELILKTRQGSEKHAKQLLQMSQGLPDCDDTEKLRRYALRHLRDAQRLKPLPSEINLSDRSDDGLLEISEEGYPQLPVRLGCDQNITFMNLSGPQANTLLCVPFKAQEVVLNTRAQPAGSCLILKNDAPRQPDRQRAMVVLSFPSDQKDYKALRRFSGCLKVMGEPVDLVLLHDGPCEIDSLVTENIERLTIISGGRLARTENNAMKIHLDQPCPLTIGPSGVSDMASQLQPIDLANATVVPFGLSQLNLVGSQQIVEGAIAAKSIRMFCPNRLDVLSSLAVDDHIPIHLNRDPRFSAGRSKGKGIQFAENARLSAEALTLCAPRHTITQAQGSEISYAIGHLEAKCCTFNGNVKGSQQLRVSAETFLVGSGATPGDFQVLSETPGGGAALLAVKVFSLGAESIAKFCSFKLQDATSLSLGGSMTIQRQLEGTLQTLEVFESGKLSMPADGVLDLEVQNVRLDQGSQTKLGHCNLSPFIITKADDRDEPTSTTCIDGRLLVQGDCVCRQNSWVVSPTGSWAVTGEKVALSTDKFLAQVESTVDLGSAHLTLGGYTPRKTCHVGWQGNITMPSQLTLASRVEYKGKHHLSVPRLHVAARGDLIVSNASDPFVIRTNELVLEAKNAFTEIAKLQVQSLDPKVPCEISMSGQIASKKLFFAGPIHLKNRAAQMCSLRLLPECQLSFDSSAFTCRAHLTVSPGATLKIQENWLVEPAVSDDDYTEDYAEKTLRFLGELIFEGGEHAVDARSFCVKADAFVRVDGTLACTTKDFSIDPKARFQVGALVLRSIPGEADLSLDGLDTGTQSIGHLTLSGIIRPKYRMQSLKAQSIRLTENSRLQLKLPYLEVITQRLTLDEGAQFLRESDQDQPIQLTLRTREAGQTLAIDTQKGLARCCVILCDPTQLLQNHLCLSALKVEAGATLSSKGKQPFVHLETKKINCGSEAALSQKESWYVGDKTDVAAEDPSVSDGAFLLLGSDVCIDFERPEREQGSSVDDSAATNPITLCWKRICLAARATLQSNCLNLMAQELSNDGIIKASQLTVASIPEHPCVCSGKGHIQAENFTAEGKVEIPGQQLRSVRVVETAQGSDLVLDQIAFDQLSQLKLSQGSEMTVKDAQSDTLLRASDHIELSGCLRYLKGNIVLESAEIPEEVECAEPAILDDKAGHLRAETNRLRVKNARWVSQGDCEIQAKEDSDLSQVELAAQGDAAVCTVEAPKITLGQSVSLPDVPTLKLVTDQLSLPCPLSEVKSIFGGVKHLVLRGMKQLDLGYSLLSELAGYCETLSCVRISLLPLVDAATGRENKVQRNRFKSISIEYNDRSPLLSDLEQLAKLCDHLSLNFKNKFSLEGASDQLMKLPCGLSVDFGGADHEHRSRVQVEQLSLRNFKNLRLVEGSAWTANGTKLGAGQRAVVIQGESLVTEAESGLASGNGCICIKTGRCQSHDGALRAVSGLEVTAGGQTTLGKHGKWHCDSGTVDLLVKKGNCEVQGEIHSEAGAIELHVPEGKIHIGANGCLEASGDIAIHCEDPSEVQPLAFFNEGLVCSNSGSLLLEAPQVLNFGNGALHAGLRCLIYGDWLINGSSDLKLINGSSDLGKILEKTGVDFSTGTTGAREALARIHNLGQAQNGQKGGCFLFVDEVWSGPKANIINHTPFTAGSSVMNRAWVIFPSRFYEERVPIISQLCDEPSFQEIQSCGDDSKTIVQVALKRLRSQGDIFIFTGSLENLDSSRLSPTTQGIQLEGGFDDAAAQVAPTKEQGTIIRKVLGCAWKKVCIGGNRLLNKCTRLAVEEEPSMQRSSSGSQQSQQAEESPLVEHRSGSISFVAGEPRGYSLLSVSKSDKDTEISVKCNGSADMNRSDGDDRRLHIFSLDGSVQSQASSTHQLQLTDQRFPSATVDNQQEDVLEVSMVVDGFFVGVLAGWSAIVLRDYLTW